MYSLAKRSDFFQSNTPINVGPGSYDTSGLIMSLAYGHAPFQSLKPRDLSLSNADAKLLPAPNEYHPRMQTRILGGSAMQNRAPRFNYRQKSGPGPCDYPPYSEDDEASTSPPHSGRLVRASTRHKTSTAAFSELAGGVPAGFQEYQEKPVRQRVRRTSQQIAKCSPCVLHGSLNLGRYRGVNFGKMTSRDAFPDNGSEPGPGDYDVGHFDLYVPVPYTNKKWWKLQNGKLLPRNPCSTVKCGSNRQTPGIILNPDDPALGEAPSRIPCSFDPDAAQPNSLRYLDVLVEKTLRENFPAPNAYHVIKDICEPLQLAKKKCGKKERERVCEEDWKEIFFQSIREKLNVKRRNMKPIVEQPFISSTARFSEPKERRPGPADYYIHASSIASETVDCPLPGVAFNHRSARFPNVKLSPTAGPGDYNMLGMTDELMRRIRPRYCWLKRDSGKKVVFGSSASRVTDLVPAWVKELPGPSDYDTRVRQCAWKYRIRICPRRPHAEFVRSSVDLGGPSMRPARTSGERTSVVEARPAGRRVTFRPCPGKRRRMGRRRRRQERLPNPFKTKKRLPEVTPGPALYYPEIAKDNAVLKKGYSVRMDSRTIRFPDTFEDIPGPGHYQTVTTEMLKRSFNVKFARLAGREPRVRPMRRDPLTAGRCVVSAEGSYCPSTSRRQAPAKVPSVLLGWRGKRFSVTRDPDENY